MRQHMIGVHGAKATGSSVALPAVDRGPLCPVRRPGRPHLEVEAAIRPMPAGLEPLDLTVVVDALHPIPSPGSAAGAPSPTDRGIVQPQFSARQTGGKRTGRIPGRNGKTSMNTGLLATFGTGRKRPETPIGIRSHRADRLPPHALSGGRPARLGATRGFTTGRQAPSSRLVRRAPRPSRCDAGFHHGPTGSLLTSCQAGAPPVSVRRGVSPRAAGRMNVGSPPARAAATPAGRRAGRTGRPEPARRRRPGPGRRSRTRGDGGRRAARAPRRPGPSRAAGTPASRRRAR